MIANSERDKMTSAERRAWLDSLSDDDWMIVYTPIGYLCNLVIISQLKRALATTRMTVAERMETLEGLSKIADKFLPAEAMAAVEPACDTAIEMFREAMTLDPKEWGVMGSCDVFSEFAKLNPSLLAALKLCNRNLSRPARREHADAISNLEA